MSIFVTGFLWGLGISLGAGIGLLVYILARDGLTWVTGQADTIQDIRHVNRASLEALQSRNELTVQIIEKLAEINDSLDRQAG